MFGRTSRPRDLIIAGEDVVNISEAPLDEIQAQARRAIEKSAEYSKIMFDQGKATVVPLAVGDLVLLKNEERNQTKLDPKYKGPFKISNILPNDRYEIVSVDGRRTYKYPHDRIRKVPDVAEQGPSLDVDSSGSEE